MPLFSHVDYRFVHKHYTGYITLISILRYFTANRTKNQMEFGFCDESLQTKRVWLLVITSLVNEPLCSANSVRIQRIVDHPPKTAVPILGVITPRGKIRFFEE